jgi:hypothetical protein
LRAIEAAIAADARARGLAGPILRAVCEPFPATVGRPRPEADLTRRRGGYACLAVTSEIARTSRNAAGVLGHPYRAAVDFATGRYAWCKISGHPGEGGFTYQREVGVPIECGGSD